MNLPTELKYVSTHEWLRLEGDTATVGITEHAQDLLGELVYVELPEVGQAAEAGAPIAVVESVKAASDVYAPVSGEVIAVNEPLGEAPETVNQDAFGQGWLFQLKLSDPSEVEQLLSAEAYAAEHGL